MPTQLADIVPQIQLKERLSPEELEMVHLVADNALASRLSRHSDKNAVLAFWTKAVSELASQEEELVLASEHNLWMIKETARRLVSAAGTNLAIYADFGFLRNLTYQNLNVVDRVREGSHLLLGMCIWAGYIAWARPSIRILLSVIVSSAYADQTNIAGTVRLVLASVISLAITLVLLISAYAAMIRRPPLEAGREFLKLTLAFASGFVTTALAFH
jgi:hypothetical protein